MEIVSGTASSLRGNTYQQLTAYRHKVFIEQLGWDLNTPDGREQDQFDRPDTVYIIARDEHSEVCGCGRLLPTTHPYLLGEVFPQLLNGAAPPCSPDVWELSRFAAVDFNTGKMAGGHLMLSEVSIAMLEAAMRHIARHGAQRLVTVSPLGIERLVRNSGFNARRAGPPKMIDGHPVIACWIDLPDHFIGAREIQTKTRAGGTGSS